MDASLLVAAEYRHQQGACTAARLAVRWVPCQSCCMHPFPCLGSPQAPLFTQKADMFHDSLFVVGCAPLSLRRVWVVVVACVRAGACHFPVASNRHLPRGPPLLPCQLLYPSCLAARCPHASIPAPLVFALACRYDTAVRLVKPEYYGSDQAMLLQVGVRAWAAVPVLAPCLVDLVYRVQTQVGTLVHT